MRKRYLTVIKNGTGLDEYDAGIEQSDNMIVRELPEEEFDDLCTSGVFKKINNVCGLMIDDYESEVIEKENLKKCIEIAEGAITSGVFLTSLTDASRVGVALAIDF